MTSYNPVFKGELWILGPYEWGVGGESRAGFLNQALGYSRRQDMSDIPAQKWLAIVPSRTNLPGLGAPAQK